MTESGRKFWAKSREKKKKEIIRAIQYRMSEINDYPSGSASYKYKESF
jgi:hypothetical protein